jgi:hypothetical protein
LQKEKGVTTATTETFLPGAALLRAWLAERRITPHRFAVENGLDPSEFSKVLKGVRRSVGVPFAVAVEDATRGDVSVRAWVPRKLEKTA